MLVLGSEVNDADQLLRRLGWQSFWAATCKTGGRTAELVTVLQIFVSQVGPISLPISLTQNKMVSFRCNESMTGPVSICIFTKKKVPSALQRWDSGVVYQLYLRGLECLGRDCGRFDCAEITI